MKILLVEDDEDQLAVREMLLKQAGFDTVAAADTNSALDAARAESPDCVLLDLSLPDENSGLSLIRELKKLYPRMPILVLTGKDPRRLNRRPERELIAGVIGKGSPSSSLIRRLTDMRTAEKLLEG